MANNTVLRGGYIYACNAFFSSKTVINPCDSSYTLTIEETTLFHPMHTTAWKVPPTPNKHPPPQWRSEGIWRPGANLNFPPPPTLKKIPKN